MACTRLDGLKLDAAFKQLLDELRTQSPEEVAHRAASAYEEIAGPASDTIVLFGAGHLGRLTAARLRQVGMEPRAFADNNPELWGKRIDGIEVLPPKAAAERFAQDSCFVVTVYHSSAPRRQLTELGCPRVASFAALCWRYPESFVPDAGINLPQHILQEIDEIERCFRTLADDYSRAELYDQVRWRTSLDYGVLSSPTSDVDQYFPAGLVTPLDDEVFVDCGAFDGDSIRQFLKCRNGRFGHIYALEPDPANRRALEAYRGSLGDEVSSRISVLPYAAGSYSALVQFASTNTAGSRITASGANTEVECRALDDLLGDVTPTYIKMDIEGAEPDAIAGTAEILRNARPVLAACLYHRSNHLWQIPNLVHSTSPNHRIFLRRYAEECWETVCYAVPEARLLTVG